MSATTLVHYCRSTMKQLITLFAFAACGTAFGTVHIVTCQNGAYHFLPVTVNANVGDTIHWTWVSGNHIVGPILETDIPTLADTWYGVINSTYHTFDYVVAQPGSYHYVCHPASPHGEDGYINVALSTSIVDDEPADNDALLYPNPFIDQLTVEANGATSIDILNLLGERVGYFALSTSRTVLRADLGTLPKGIYFASILRKGLVLETRRMVKQ